MNHLQNLPDRQLWSRAALGGVDAAEIGTFTTPLVREAETIAAVGTRLAAQLARALGANNFTLLRAEQPHPALAGIPAEVEEYASSSAGQGEIWSAPQLLQLIRRSARTFAPEVDRRREGDLVVDPFRPGLKYPARSDHEFDLLLERHLNAVRSMFRRSAVLIVALGASEICESRADRAVLPLRLDSPPDHFDPERYAVRTLTVEETIADLEVAVRELRTMNPHLRIILMVSPEPPPATAMPVHVVAASAYGKAILRVAMEQAARLPGVCYFPAMEILASLGAAAFDQDGRVLTSKAVDAVAAAMLAASEGGHVAMELEKDSPEAMAAFSPPPEPTSGEIEAERRRRRAAEPAGKAPPPGKAPAAADPDEEFAKLVRSRERQERAARRALARHKPGEADAGSHDTQPGVSPQREARPAPAGDADIGERPVRPRRRRRKGAEAIPPAAEADAASAEAAASPEQAAAAAPAGTDPAEKPAAHVRQRRRRESKQAAETDADAHEGAVGDESRDSRRRRRREARAASKTHEADDASAGETPAQPVTMQPEGSSAAEAGGAAADAPASSQGALSERSRETGVEHASRKQRRREKKASKSGAAEGS